MRHIKFLGNYTHHMEMDQDSESLLNIILKAAASLGVDKERGQKKTLPNFRIGVVHPE